MKHKMWILSLIMAVIIVGFTPFPFWVQIIACLVFAFCNQFIPIVPFILALGIFIYCFIQVLSMPWWAMLIFFALVAFYIIWCVLIYKELKAKADRQDELNEEI